MRVAYAGPIGAYAEERLIAADRVVRLPSGISDEIAASIMLKGMTAQYLLRRTYKVGPKTTLLFHAAAGGVGLIACQWAAALGATVIGTVGSAGKALIARAHGCTHVINYREEDFVTMVKAYTDGKGVDVVYDSIGKDTFPASLDCLKPLGMWVSFGQASGPVPEFKITLLSQKGSLYATRPSLQQLHGDPEGPGRHGQRSVRRGRLRQGEGLGQPDLSSGRGRARASGSRGASDHRLDGAVADHSNGVLAALRRSLAF